MNCEIVEGGCFATVYKYCRTHRCEPADCPNGKEPNVFPPWMGVYKTLEELQKDYKGHLVTLDAYDLLKELS